MILLAYSIRSYLFVLASKKITHTDNMKKNFDYVKQNKKGYRFSALKKISHSDSKVCNFSSYEFSLSNPVHPHSHTHEDFNLPFVSIVIASYNEGLVIDRLIRSCASLTYDSNRYEIVVVDDSDDNTFEVLTSWRSKIPNLKIYHRTSREGWKGGALNMVLPFVNAESCLVLIVDADSVLIKDTLEKFVSYFIRSADCMVVQGYPISSAYFNHDNVITRMPNWVARAIDYRLAQRNLVEFCAKNYLGLPVQVTGSLFMIKTDLIKSIGFSGDLCEDWDLTLDLYLGSKKNDNIQGGVADRNKTIAISKIENIVFDKSLISICEATTALSSYFRQRLRVSEGHTRGLIKRLVDIIRSKNLSILEKLELLLIGFQYAKFIFVFSLLFMDSVILLSKIYFHFDYYAYLLTGVLLLIQGSVLASTVISHLLVKHVCSEFKNYTNLDLFYTLILSIVTIPAIMMGSILGICRTKGIFLKTRRNPGD